VSLRDRLDDLDDRFATTGPLALLREVPQLAMFLVAVVFCAGTGTVLARSGNDDLETGGGVTRPALQAPSEGVLGPQLGERVDAYYADARAGLARAQQSAPRTATLALVTLRTTVTPQQAQALTAGLQVNRVYLRAAAARRPETAAVAVTNLLPDLTKAYTRLAARKGQEVAAARRLAQSIDRRTFTQDRAAADDDVRVLTTERAAYANRCACVMALLVTSTPGLLAELLLNRGVAAVQVARTTTLAGLEVRPLAPQAAAGGVVRPLPEPPRPETAN
jgi:hypothetical protein